jgi:putative hydrolase of the HAD superfamily
MPCRSGPGPDRESIWHALSERGLPTTHRYHRAVPYRAVFFDAGETLLYPHPGFAELFALVLREEGHEVDPADIQGQMPAVSALFIEATRMKQIWSNTPERSRQFWHRVYQVIFDGVGVEATSGAFDRLEAEFTNLGNYRLFPDVLPTLDALEGAGLCLGVVSNFEDWLERLLVHLGVSGYFDVQVISGVEGVEKPDPAIFQRALDRSGIPPEEFVFVGDSIEYDVEPAEALGMLGVLIDRRGRHPDHRGTRVTSLEHLPEALGLPG